MDITYVRCKECGYVYDGTLDKCPHCGAETPITEDFGNEPVFNILD